MSGNFIRHEACPKCNSSDAFAIYSDEGGGHCFSCGHTKPSKEYLEKNGFGYEWKEEDGMGIEFNVEVHDQIKEDTVLEGYNYRGIPTNVSKPCGVRYKVEDGEVVRTYYPVTRDYEICGYKVRNHPKDFRGGYGYLGSEADMFMQFKFKTHSGMCVIVGGEHDALAAYAMLKTQQKDKRYDEIAVVAPIVGETSAYTQVKNNYAYFTQMKRIILCMDNDEAGKKATELLAEVLPKGKVYVMNMRRKDPNSYLYDKETGKTFDFTNEFISDFWAMKPYAPEGVKSAAESFDEIEEELLKPRITLPPFMHKMQEMMGGGIIQGRIANIIADTSVGKSTFVNRMVYHWIFHSPEVPTIVSLEAQACIDLL